MAMLRLVCASTALWIASGGMAFAMDIVDGAACAHLALQIEDLGLQNEEMLNAISEAQVEASANRKADPSGAMMEQHKALVALRQTWIAEYESQCANASMNVKDLTRICRPAGGQFKFRDTAFCKPVREAGL
jgi:hypothetical protein